MSKSDQLEAAAEQIFNALSSLETSILTAREKNATDAGLLARIEALSAERDALKAENEKMRERMNRLEATNNEVANRLDLAINSIKSVLGAT